MPAGALLPCTLAQSGSAAAVGVLPWIVGLIVAVVIAGYAILALRRRLIDDPGSTDTRSLFEDLEAMHRRGELSDEELARAKRSVAERLARGPARTDRATGPR